MDQIRVAFYEKAKRRIAYADPKVRGFKELLVKGGAFYAVYDPATHLWSQDIERLSELIDNDIQQAIDNPDNNCTSAEYMNSMSNGRWNRYIASLKNLKDSKAVLNQRIIFNDREPKLEDYATTQVPYSVKKGSTAAYDELMSTLYSPEERRKLEWAIGALVHGDELERIQKMFVIYGDPGAGKSTVLKIIEMLFPGYIAYFSADQLGSGYQFATSVFKSSPLIGIQHDGDLSRMWDNATINQIVSHETININEKGVKQYPLKTNTMLFMATNKPVKITDSKAGLLRRLIDIQPSGNRLPADRYFKVNREIEFELGAIAYHCEQVYLKSGYAYYNNYVPTRMISRTNDVYNFIDDNIGEVNKEGGVSLSHLWKLYRQWCEDANVTLRMKRTDFMYELETYFGKMTRSSKNQNSSAGVRFDNFKVDKFLPEDEKLVEIPVENEKLSLEYDTSEFDIMATDYPAQYARNDFSGAPRKQWDSVTTTLKDIDTHKLHWVQVPENHIVIDFDLRGPDGEKSLDANLEAAAKFPPTYAEVSKSGKGVHLHYIYDGDVSKLKNLYDTFIEIKVYSGKASLRRQLSKCNNLPVNHISSGLPLKGEKSMLIKKGLKNEQHLRAIINKALQKKYHAGTKPSIDFIAMILDEAYDSEIPYDVTDLRDSILNFAMGSTHWADHCVQVVGEMKFKSEKPPTSDSDKGGTLVFYDVEVFPNLFMICWKRDGEKSIQTLINPSREEVTSLTDFDLVGFNNRRYDNHILYAWGYLGYTNQQLYDLSRRIVSGDPNACFGSAYDLSYTDIYDFAQKKQSLKKWEIELGIDHKELGIPWDQPVPEDLWPTVQSYCENDVRATEVVFHHLHNDFVSRKILSAMSGLSYNQPNNSHTSQIIFGAEKNPQTDFNFPDLSELFPGYEFNQYAPKDQKSTYMGEYPSEGGYVWVYGMENGDEDQDYQDITPRWERKDVDNPYSERKVNA